MRPVDPESLRERKKARTREAIADAALALFLERGFDNVTVAEVAQAAEVAEKTVFNYFSCKEELFFDLDTQIEDRLISLVKNRGARVSVVEALHAFKYGDVPDDGDDPLRSQWERHMRVHGHHHGLRFDENARRHMERMQHGRAQQNRFREAVLEKIELLEKSGASGAVREKLMSKLLEAAPSPQGAPATGSIGFSMDRFRQVVLESPALIAYQRQMFARYEERLRAALLEEIKADDIRARMEAHVFAAGVVAALRFQFEMDDVGPSESQRLFARGLRTLERGFDEWLPKKR